METPVPYIVGNVIYTTVFRQSYELRPDPPRYQAGSIEYAEVTAPVLAFRKVCDEKGGLAGEEQDESGQ